MVSIIVALDHAFSNLLKNGRQARIFSKIIKFPVMNEMKQFLRKNSDNL